MSSSGSRNSSFQSSGWLASLFSTTISLVISSTFDRIQSMLRPRGEMLFSFAQCFMYSRQIFEHLPMPHRATGSPTTVTDERARVRAKFSNFSSLRKSNARLSNWSGSTKRWVVRTVEMKTARNSFPLENKNIIPRRQAWNKSSMHLDHQKKQLFY